MIKYIYIYIYGSYSLGLKVILVGLLKLILKYLIFSNYQIKKEKNANKMVTWILRMRLVELLNNLFSVFK